MPSVPRNKPLWPLAVCTMAISLVPVLVWGILTVVAVDAYKIRLQNGYDALLATRCEARCSGKRFKSSCTKSCLVSTFIKPGRCPSKDTVLSPFDAVCLNTCKEDSQCSALTKCCQHSCGVTCQHPEKISTAAEVPNIPTDVKVTETSKKRTIRIAWTSPSNSAHGTIVYLLEERHHAGRNFIEEDLSEWSPCGLSFKNVYFLRNFVKPGAWYQFKVAAVNENGTKGFSQHSPTFSVSLRPKPPKAPQNVSVSTLWTDIKGTLFGELRWLPPESDLPVQRYKVFWSRRLHGANALNSVLVHQRTVSKDQNKFLLQNLKPDSLYFLQIQAIVQFGRNRLKGQKAGLVLNTTNFRNVTGNLASTESTNDHKILDLQLEKIYWTKSGLRGRIIWKLDKESARFTVSVWMEPRSDNSKMYKQFKLAAVTEVPYFEIHELQFDYRYRVGVKKVADEELKSINETYISFVTPQCQDFKKKNGKVRCN